MHWLNRLLSPSSIAIVGATDRPGSIGNTTLGLIGQSGFSGAVFPVNPNRSNIDGLVCYPSLADLPQSPDLVVFAVSGTVLEQSFNQAITVGAGGAVIYANNYLADDTDPPLLERLRHAARSANLPVCGGNCMGFQNYPKRTLISFDIPPPRPSGHITLIAHSGSAMTYLANHDPRYCYNLAVSCGQEINGTFVDYMDYALQQEETRVIALFVESVRDPAGFVRVLGKAQRSNIPVVAVKVGRTEQSARFAASHSGAIAGSDEAFQAVCDRYGVIRVAHLDELAETAYLLSQPWKLSTGGLASVTDSGGLREQMIDLADELQVPLASISEDTRTALTDHLEYGLEADNPLDAMGSFNADIKATYSGCMRALSKDPDTALLSLEFEFRDDFCHYPELFEVARDYAGQNETPLMIINSVASARTQETALGLSRAGIPVINGVEVALKAVRNALRHHQRQRHVEMSASALEGPTVDSWRRRILNGTMDEAAALAMFSDFGLPVVPHRCCGELEDVLAAAADVGFPVALKTAEDIAHKSDAGGVHLTLKDETSLTDAYGDLHGRLGSRVLVATMAPAGVELALGMVNDPQFGPLVMISAGGTRIEWLEDRVFALAPFCQETAVRLIQRLKIATALSNPRGSPPLDIHGFAALASQFSGLVAALSDCLMEVDVNPVIVHQQGCTIVDALVVPGQRT